MRTISTGALHLTHPARLQGSNSLSLKHEAHDQCDSGRLHHTHFYDHPLRLIQDGALLGTLVPSTQRLTVRMNIDKSPIVQTHGKSQRQIDQNDQKNLELMIRFEINEPCPREILERHG